MTRWTDEEARRLLNLALKSRKAPSGVVDWGKVMEQMPGRTKPQCQTYINNYLRRHETSKYKDLRHNYKWTVADEEKLLELSRRHQNDWDLIRERHFPKLTVRKIKNKYIELVKKELSSDDRILEKLIAMLAES